MFWTIVKEKATNFHLKNTVHWALKDSFKLHRYVNIIVGEKTFSTGKASHFYFTETALLHMYIQISWWNVHYNTCSCKMKKCRLLGPHIERCGCPIVITSSVCPSVRPHFLLCCDNSNTFLPRTFKLCIWVIYQIRRTPIVFGVITSKVKVTGCGGAPPDLVSILVVFTVFKKKM